MSESLLIKYKDPTREDTFHPFSFQSVMESAWRPLARKLGLELVEFIGIWSIQDRDLMERLVAELRVMESFLCDPNQATDWPEQADYMRTRLGEVLPLLHGALTEWEQVERVSL